MHWLTYLIFLIACYQFHLINASGHHLEFWTNEQGDELKTGMFLKLFLISFVIIDYHLSSSLYHKDGWEWHLIDKGFYENFSLTKNVFDFHPDTDAQITLNLNSVKDKLKGYSFNNLGNCNKH